MRIVVDTNIFLGACLGAGPASAVISACLRGQAVPLMGNALFNEYEDVLARTELFSQSRLNHEERNELLDIFLFKGITIMTALTIRLPDDKYGRLKEVANQLGTSINRLIDEMTTLLLADMDTETRFLIRAERGSGKVERGLELLEKGLSQ